ncbi:MAG: twin-arginine translocase subunit TatC [Marinilabiliaceae bacterium]
MNEDTKKSFWEHLDDLRALLFRLLAVLCVATIACFCLKDELFSVVLAPSKPDFLIYRLLSGLGTPNLPAGLVNTTLGGQLMTHFKVAMGAGVVISAPIGIYIIARYLAPALYPKERRAMTAAFTWGTLLFFAGMVTAYLVVFPFAYQFLANYEVSPEVSNLFTLESYIDNLLLLVLLMGVLFELPVVAVLLNKVGLVSAGLMKRYRRHAVLAIVTASAIITPTTDIFTLSIVSLPICLLYELSIHLVK